MGRGPRAELPSSVVLPFFLPSEVAEAAHSGILCWEAYNSSGGASFVGLFDPELLAARHDGK
jgi:hypothetical protein